MTCQCSVPITNGDFICTACVADLRQVLAEVDSVVDDLVRAVPRASLTAGYGERVSSSGSLHAPLPINENALDAHMALDKYLMFAALELAKVTQVRIAGRDSKALSSYIYTHLGTLKTLHWAGSAKTTLQGLIRDCQKATHTATQAQFAGTCPEDGTELYAHAGDNTATCRTCTTVYTDIQEWRTSATEYAKAQDDSIVGYPDAISKRLARVHGEEITPEHVRLLASRGLLIRANPEHNEHGKVLRPMYRLGDVKALIKPKEEAA